MLSLARANRNLRKMEKTISPDTAEAQPLAERLLQSAADIQTVEMPTLADDLLSGVNAIAEFIGESRRRTYYLLEGRRLPAGKLGDRWIASRRVLRRHYARLTEPAVGRKPRCCTPAVPIRESARDRDVCRCPIPVRRCRHVRAIACIP